MSILKSVFTIFLAASGWALGENPKIERVSLFKNGIAVVKLHVKIEAKKKLELDAIPAPVNGTFWVVSKEPLTSQVAIRDFDSDLASMTKEELLGSLGAQEVELTLDSGDFLRGKIIAPRSPRSNDSRNNNQASLNLSNYYLPNPGFGWNNRGQQLATPDQNSMIFIEVPNKGIVAMNPAEIKQIQFSNPALPKRKKPVLILQSRDGKNAEASVEYLTKGISWAPSYRLNLRDDKSLTIRQKAVVRNELSDLVNTEIRAISGFPSVKFASVESPMGPDTNWARFFQQLGQLDSNSARGGSVILNQGNFAQIGHGSSSGIGAGANLPPEQPGKGSVDLHYSSLGTHDLGVGESLIMEVAKADAEYKRIVDWKVPDWRNEHGRPISEHDRRREPEKYEPASWDAVLFDNPFEFPMTTAPAMVVQSGDFLGQQQVTWTNPGEELTVRINKALSIVNTVNEIEQEGARQKVRLWGSDFYRTKVSGLLTLTNYRSVQSDVRIRREFSGKLLTADLEPDSRLLEKGIYSVNERRELTWNISVKPGETKNLKYDYEVLVRN